MSRPAKFERELVFRSPDFPLDVAIWEDHPDYPIVTHDFFEIIVVLSGTALKQVAGHVYPLKAGDVFALKGETPHGYRNTRHLTVVNITYDPVVLDHLKFDVAALPGYQDLFFAGAGAASSASYRLMHLDMDQLQQVRRLAETIERELHPSPQKRRAVRYQDRQTTAVSKYEPPPPDRACQFMAIAHFMQLVGLLSRWRFHKPKLVSEKLINIERAIDHLQRHFSEDMDLSRVAAQVGMSYRNFHRVFLKSTGRSPIDYLRSLRLSKATQVLRTTNQSITEIALACGFTDSSYFARSFRQETGVSPREFRMLAQLERVEGVALIQLPDSVRSS